jgi:hypothetical protein
MLRRSRYRRMRFELATTLCSQMQTGLTHAASSAMPRAPAFTQPPRSRRRPAAPCTAPPARPLAAQHPPRASHRRGRCRCPCGGQRRSRCPRHRRGPGCLTPRWSLRVSRPGVRGSPSRGLWSRAISWLQAESGWRWHCTCKPVHVHEAAQCVGQVLQCWLSDACHAGWMVSNSNEGSWSAHVPPRHGAAALPSLTPPPRPPPHHCCHLHDKSLRRPGDTVCAGASGDGVCRVLGHGP